jgi:very-short-patch-repair endonuclease
MNKQRDFTKLANLSKPLQNSHNTNTPPSEGPGEVSPRYITANPATYKLIKQMRENLKNNPTKAEQTLWKFLQNKKIGHKIRRQHIIDEYITDFVCLAKKVVIEIDGKIHLKQKNHDEVRTKILNESGYKVLRFTNEEVFKNPELIALKIKKYLDLPNPSEGGALEA